MENPNDGSLSIKFGNETFSLHILNGIQGMNRISKSDTSPKFKYSDFKRENGKWSTSINA